MERKDAGVKDTHALPNGAANITSDGLDTGAVTAHAKQPGEVEWLLSAPLQNVTQMPNSKTMIYDIVTSASSNMGTPTTLIAAAITQTGAGGVGCAAAEYRFRLPSNAQRYIGFKATGSASGDSSGANGTLEALF